VSDLKEPRLDSGVKTPSSSDSVPTASQNEGESMEGPLPLSPFEYGQSESARERLEARSFLDRLAFGEWLYPMPALHWPPWNGSQYTNRVLISNATALFIVGGRGWYSRSSC
jgi:hypothetical protein